MIVENGVEKVKISYILKNWAKEVAKNAQEMKPFKKLMKLENNKYILLVIFDGFWWKVKNSVRTLLGIEK